MKTMTTIRYGKGKEYEGYLATPEKAGTYPALILIHEIWGLDAHTKNVSDRFAEQGFVVLAPDLLGDTGILEKISPSLYADLQDPEKRHEAQAKMREAMQPLSTKEYAAEALSKLEGAFSFLKAHESSNGNVGVMGFCFGGTYSFALATQEAGLKAAVVFYGQPPQILESVKNISCPVLGLYGEQDTRLIDSLPQVTEEMKKYDKDFTAKVYKNTGHAFFNDTNARAYNKEAAEDAWLVVNTFLKTHLK